MKVNIDKTKLVWIGKKRYSKEKLLIDIPLSWGNMQFHFLGIDFSVNLDDIVDLNYRPVIKKIDDLLKTWKFRSLNPLPNPSNNYIH